MNDIKATWDDMCKHCVCNRGAGYNADKPVCQECQGKARAALAAKDKALEAADKLAHEVDVCGDNTLEMLESYRAAREAAKETKCTL